MVLISLVSVLNLYYYYYYYYYYYALLDPRFSRLWIWRLIGEYYRLSIKNYHFWDVTPCIFVSIYQSTWFYKLKDKIFTAVYSEKHVFYFVSVSFTSVTRQLQWKFTASHRTLSKTESIKILILNALLKYGVLQVDEDKVVDSFPYFLPNKATPENSPSSVLLTVLFLTSVSCNPIKGETNFPLGFNYLRRAQSNSYHSVCPYSGTS